MLNRIRFLILTSLGLSITLAAPDKSVALNARIDSLSRHIAVVQSKADSLASVLKEAQLAGSYMEKSMAHIIETDKKVMDNQYSFMAWMGGIWALGIFGIGLFIWKRSSDEREYIGRSVRDSVEPTLRKYFEEVDGKATTLRTDLNAHLTKYIEFHGEINRKADRIDLIDSRLSLLPEIQGQALYSYSNHFLDGAWKRLNFGEHDEAVDNAAFVIQTCEKGKESSSGRIMIESASRALCHFIATTVEILPRTNQRIKRILPLIPENHRPEIISWLESVSVVDTLSNNTFIQNNMPMPIDINKSKLPKSGKQ